MIKAIAIDDEPLALEVIDFYCQSISNINLEKTFSNLEKAKEYLNKFPVDIIFLDIEMPKINGVEFYKSLNVKVKVIFTTAYNQYAVEGFNVCALDYLLKPFSFQRFKEAIEKFENNTANELEENNYLLIRANYTLNRIVLDDILYIEAMSDYVKIHIHKASTIVARSTMKSILEKIPKELFIRIHKSYIIPKRNIKNINMNEISLGYVKLPIGNSYKKECKSLF